VSELIDWDKRITLAEAARISGLAQQTLSNYAATGRLKSELVTPRLRMTTRRWLDAMLRERGPQPGEPGRPPKSLAPDYTPPPRRGRPRRQTPAPAPDTPPPR